MRTAKNWKDYIIHDTSDGEKLETWGGISLVRPDPQIIWKTERRDPLWKNADGHYHLILNDAALMDKVAGYDITLEVIDGLNARYQK